MELQCINTYCAPIIRKSLTDAWISLSVDMPVEQIMGLFFFAIAVSKSWFVISAEATLNA